MLDLVLFLVFAAIVAALLLYGFFPRSIERALSIEYANRGDDLIFLRINNDDYFDEFISLNEMFADVMTREEFKEMSHEESSSSGKSMASTSAL